MSPGVPGEQWGHNNLTSTLSNRYDMLKDNEWLRDADDSENNESNLSQSAQDNKTAKKAPRNKAERCWSCCHKPRVDKHSNNRLFLYLK